LAQATLLSFGKRESHLTILRMAVGRVFAIAALFGSSAVALGEECSADGECGSEESSLLSLRSNQDSETRRRLPPSVCWNRHGNQFQCAGGDRCCGDVCVGMGDLCCENVNGDNFPCQGGGGQCCGNACAAPGSKCCKSAFVDKSRWYPVTKDTECAFTDGPHHSPTACSNRQGTKFMCAGGDRCCGDVCVAKGDICCENVNGNSFPCQGGGGQCCGNACAAPGSKCCKSPLVEKSRWYPVSKDTKCAF